MNKNKAHKKHDGYICTLANELCKYEFIKEIKTEVEYPLGECDLILIYVCNLEEYIEVKSTDSPKAYSKAIDQLLRWTRFMKGKLNKNYYGTYWTPTYSRTLIKDGRLL